MKSFTSHINLNCWKIDDKCEAPVDLFLFSKCLINFASYHLQLCVNLVTLLYITLHYIQYSHLFQYVINKNLYKLFVNPYYVTT